jgi:hypothetical protein
MEWSFGSKAGWDVKMISRWQDREDWLQAATMAEFKQIGLSAGLRSEV